MRKCSYSAQRERIVAEAISPVTVNLGFSRAAIKRY